jgi:hypothetical protein
MPGGCRCLSFSHICTKTGSEKSTVLPRTMRKTWQAKLKQVYSELKRHIHDQISEQRAYVQQQGAGHSETKRLNSLQMFTGDAIERYRIIELRPHLRGVGQASHTHPSPWHRCPSGLLLGSAPRRGDNFLHGCGVRSPERFTPMPNEKKIKLTRIECPTYKPSLLVKPDVTVCPACRSPLSRLQKV